MNTTVINIRANKSKHYYIGRNHLGEIPETIGLSGWLGNPFKISKNKLEMSRDRSIVKFAFYFYKKIQFDPSFKQTVDSLRGQTLGCWCKPANCHGDVIVQYLNTGKIWTPEFVLDNDGGKGIRIKSKPSNTAVTGGAGSRSQMLKDYFDKVIINQKENTIRFDMVWAINHEYLLDHSWLVDEYEAYRNYDPNQLSLEEVF